MRRLCDLGHVLPHVCAYGDAMMFDAEDLNIRTDLVESWLENTPREILIQTLQDPSLDRRDLDDILGALIRSGYPYGEDLREAVLPLLNHEGKYIFLSALQYLLRAFPHDMDGCLCALPIPQHRIALARSLREVLSHVEVFKAC